MVEWRMFVKVDSGSSSVDEDLKKPLGECFGSGSKEELKWGDPERRQDVYLAVNKSIGLKKRVRSGGGGGAAAAAADGGGGGGGGSITRRRMSNSASRVFRRGREWSGGGGSDGKSVNFYDGNDDDDDDDDDDELCFVTLACS